MGVYHSAEEALNVAVYRYDMDQAQGWEPITTPSGLLYMLTMLDRAYRDVPFIVGSMHEKGLTARTEWGNFRATKHLDVASP